MPFAVLTGCAHLHTASHTVYWILVFNFCLSGDSCASFGFWLLSWMPRLTNNSLASCSGTDLSFLPVTSDVISSASTSLAYIYTHFI